MVSVLKHAGNGRKYIQFFCTPAVKQLYRYITHEIYFDNFMSSYFKCLNTKEITIKGIKH